MNVLAPVDLRLLNEFQHDFPLVSNPYQVIGERLGLQETEVIDRLHTLQKSGVVSRVGAVLKTGQIGASTLAAMEVPPQDLEHVANLVSSFPEVNHNYERDHAINLWFVVTTDSWERLSAILQDIEEQTGIPVHKMPMVKEYHIDLGFPFQ